MFRRRLFHLAQLGAVGFTGFFIGRYKDGLCRPEDTILLNGKALKSMPGLPIFGTVSAATPFVEGGSRVSLNKINLSSWLWSLR